MSRVLCLLWISEAPVWRWNRLFWFCWGIMRPVQDCMFCFCSIKEPQRNTRGFIPFRHLCSALHFLLLCRLCNIAWQKDLCGQYWRRINIISPTSFTSPWAPLSTEPVWKSLQERKAAFWEPRRFVPSVLKSPEHDLKSARQVTWNQYSQTQLRQINQGWLV